MAARCVVLIDNEYLHSHAKLALTRMAGLPEDTPTQVSVHAVGEEVSIFFICIIFFQVVDI